MARSSGARPPRWPLVALWLGLCALIALVLLSVAPPPPFPEPVAADPVVQRGGPAEDTDADAAALDILAARSVALEAPPHPGADRPSAPMGAAGLRLTTGGPPQPLRAAPDRQAAALVQVPDGAVLEDLGESTPDGAWQRVSWGGWDGWIAAGLLRRG